MINGRTVYIIIHFAYLRMIIITYLWLKTRPTCRVAVQRMIKQASELWLLTFVRHLWYPTIMLVHCWVMLILIIDNHLCILDSFGVEMEKLSNKFDISTILTEGDPVTSAQGVSFVTNTCIFNGKFTVCIEGGFCLNIKG